MFLIAYMTNDYPLQLHNSERVVVVIIILSISKDYQFRSSSPTTKWMGSCGSGSGDDEQDRAHILIKLTLSISTKKLSPPTTQWAAVTIHFEATKDPPHIDC